MTKDKAQEIVERFYFSGSTAEDWNKSESLEGKVLTLLKEQEEHDRDLEKAFNDLKKDVGEELANNVLKKKPFYLNSFFVVESGKVSYKALDRVNILLMRPENRKVKPLREWVNIFMTSTPEDWGGNFFHKAGLVRVKYLDGWKNYETGLEVL